MLKNITPTELKARLDAGENIVIVDVRELWEVQTSRLVGTLHIPIDEVPDSFAQIPRDTPVVVMCHHGSRSAYVAQWLHMRGFANVLNLLGGIDRWSCEVDSSVPIY